MEVTAVLLVATGLLLGLGHSLDADHVVAVSTLISSSPTLRKSIVSATAWGAGHSLTLFFVGLIVLALRVVIPENLVQTFEFVPGILLIVLGVLVVKPLVANKIRQYKLGGHVDVQDPSIDSSEKERANVHKSVFTGILQGLAGSATLMLLTLTTVDSPVVGLIFVLMFGAGVILGMVCIACLISSLLAFASTRLKKTHEIIRAFTGGASISFGAFIILQAAFQFHF